MKTKMCCTCKVVQSVSDFYKDTRNSDSLYPSCKRCHNKRCTSWSTRHPKQCTEAARRCYARNRPRILARMRAREYAQPWISTWRDVNARCTNPRATSYKNYGGKGIQNLLHVWDCKELWFRDKAYNMTRPSIDRKCTYGHYTFENCQYIELSENIKKKWREYRARQAQA